MEAAEDRALTLLKLLSDKQ
jgi:hypothetical protein